MLAPADAADDVALRTQIANACPMLPGASVRVCAYYSQYTTRDEIVDAPMLILLLHFAGCPVISRQQPVRGRGSGRCLRIDSPSVADSLFFDYRLVQECGQ